jgi:hypothetical protein
MRKMFTLKSMFWSFGLFALFGITCNFYSALYSAYLLSEFAVSSQVIGLILGGGAVVNSIVGFGIGQLLDKGVTLFYQFCIYWVI